MKKNRPLPPTEATKIAELSEIVKIQNETLVSLTATIDHQTDAVRNFNDALVIISNRLTIVNEKLEAILERIPK